MTRFHNKQDLVAAIVTEHRRLDAYLAVLTHQEMLLPGVVGSWTTKDLIAHLTAWEQLFIYWYDCGLRCAIADPSPTGMSRHQIDTLNTHIYTVNRDCFLDEVLGKFRGSFTQVLDLVQGLPEVELFSREKYTWTGRHSLADYIAANTCQHYYWAKTLLRRWLMQQGKINAQALSTRNTSSLGHK